MFLKPKNFVMKSILAVHRKSLLSTQKQRAFYLHSHINPSESEQYYIPGSMEFHEVSDRSIHGQQAEQSYIL